MEEESMVVDSLQPPGNAEEEEEEEEEKEEERSLFHGVPLSVAVYVGRLNVKHAVNVPDTAQIHHVVWEDGTREQMTCEMVNEGELRGWWARKGDTFAFTSPVTAISSLDVGPWPSNAALRIWTSWKLKPGQRAWRTRIQEYDVLTRTSEDVQIDYVFTGMELTDRLVLLTERKVYASGSIVHDSVEFPVTKFVEHFNPCGRTRRVFGSSRMIAEHRRVRVYERIRTRFALTVATLWKIKVQWKKLHLRCEEKKYAPGGEGHKRARADFEKQRGGDGHMLARGLAIRGFDILDDLNLREGSSSSQA